MESSEVLQLLRGSAGRRVRIKTEDGEFIAHLISLESPGNFVTFTVPEVPPPEGFWAKIWWNVSGFGAAAVTGMEAARIQSVEVLPD